MRHLRGTCDLILRYLDLCLSITLSISDMTSLHAMIRGNHHPFSSLCFLVDLYSITSIYLIISRFLIFFSCLTWHSIIVPLFTYHLCLPYCHVILRYPPMLSHDMLRFLTHEVSIHCVTCTRGLLIFSH